MHVKYASRHALYPVPNVFVPVAMTVVAARALRATLAGVPLRAVVVVVAARDVVARAVVVDAVRATVFVDAVRADTPVALRNVVVLAVLRVVAVRDCALTVVAPPRDAPDCD